jgi:hypothetical protein
MNIAARAQAILLNPAAEWTRIEQEPGDPVYLLTHYVAPLALIPILSGFIGACVIGVVVPGGGSVRTPTGEGVLGAVFGYLAAFAVVLLVGALIDLLAPRFGGRRDFTRAFELAVYAFTPVWFAGVFLLLPGLRFLELTGFYGAYLLVKGLPVLMKSREPQSQAYAAAIVVIAAALTLIAGAAQHSLFGTSGI